MINKIENNFQKQQTSYQSFYVQVWSL